MLYCTVATGDGCTQGGNLCVTSVTANGIGGVKKLTYNVYFNASSIYWEDLSYSSTLQEPARKDEHIKSRMQAARLALANHYQT